MPTIKIYPPSQLPEKKLTETQFNIWREELEVYLSQEKCFKVFLPGEIYHQWESAETYSHRIRALNNADVVAPDGQINRATAEQENEEKLSDIRVHLRTVLAIVGKCVSEGHYNTVVRHSTSLEWIYDTIRSDYDIQTKGIHLLNIIDLKYDPDVHTAVAFYNEYRSIIVNNLAKNGDIIKYKNNEHMQQDERMSPMIEDLILLNVLREIDERLLNFVKNYYNHKMGENDRLMDFKSDILVNVSSFVSEIENNEDGKKDAALNAIKRVPFKRNKKSAQPGHYCRLCWLAKLPRELYTSHDIGDESCSQLSYQDKRKLKDMFKLNTIKRNDEEDPKDEDIASQYGYGVNTDESNEEEVIKFSNLQKFNNYQPRTEEIQCNRIVPVNAQILTVFRDSNNKNPLHIELDSGASINFCREKEALDLGFKISYCKQISKLGDGHSKLESIGEITETFYRNNWSVLFRAAVCRDLSAPFIGGTVFMRDNGIEQDFACNVIRLLHRTATVQPTDPVSLLTTAPIFSSLKVNPKCSSKLLTFNSQWLLPGQEIDVKLPEKIQNEKIVAVEPYELNENPNWPEPDVKTVYNGSIKLSNSLLKPIHLGKEVKRCKITNTTYPKTENRDYYCYEAQLLSFKDNNVNDIKTDHIKCQEARKIIMDAHNTYNTVFNKSLAEGYNNYYGKHECSLNWASSERPTATKVNVPNYDHELQVLQQEVMDELTDQNVLLIPQEHDIQIQAVCPSFLQRKQRAKEKPKNQLTKNDVRLLINFGPVNAKIKPVPNHVPKVNDVFIKLGRWKHIICIDLYNGYFQLKMSSSSIPWLGIQTPFGGMRTIARAGQGLMGMAEEFEELTSKILKEEMKEGICSKIVDDIYIGGENEKQTALNYVRILAKFHNANIKLTPEKTSIFPSSVDVLGWVWKEGGLITPSPHRKSALENMTTQQIKTVKDMRSWIGLYKTLHVATPRLALTLAPFEDAIKDRNSNDQFDWTYQLEQEFKRAKLKLKDLVTLYLPAPEDQLILEVDAAKGGTESNPGIGHVLYAIKNNEKKIVRLHSSKLDSRCLKWNPCELEALAFATGIQKEQDIIRESKLPLIIMPDSKPVHEAVKLINQGKFSTSARMASFLNNLNRFRIESKHISGKAKLNPISDQQSRAPAECNTELCSIHKFLEEQIHGDMEPLPQLGKILNEETFKVNRQAWKKAQSSNQACTVAIKLLNSGKPPPKAYGKHNGDFWNDVRKYCRDTSIATDGTLIVKSPPLMLSGNIARERIVIPKELTPALLYHMHNHNDNHPAKSQQKALFQRNFYAIGLDKHLDELYDNCYKCSIVQKLPKETIPHESKTIADSPHMQFHADVIRRTKQYILTVRDHFTSFQDAILIKSEQAEELKQGIIALTSAMRRPGPIFITVDNSPGFQSLSKKKDKDLSKLHITIITTDEINKNANAIIDKGCRELEEELKRLDPEEKQITNSTLKLATLNLNSKLRRRGGISAFELSTARDQETGTNLQLNDVLIREHQLKTRKQTVNIADDNIQVGDSVRIKNKTHKHRANDLFLVTGKENEQLELQKIANTLSQQPAKLMGKIYKTKAKYLVATHRPRSRQTSTDNHNESAEQEIKKENKNFVAIPKKQMWSPINKQFFLSDESDDDEIADMKIKKETVRFNSDFEFSEDQLQWDHSPEQYNLGEPGTSDDELQGILLPQPIFQLDNTTHDDSSSHEEVFMLQSPPIPRNPKLKRRNAMRVKNRTVPRVTRSSLRHKDGTERNARSQNSSPTEQNLHRCQNLEMRLHPRRPIVADAVLLDQRQDLTHVLNEIHARSSRRTLRSIPRVDYAKLHQGEM